MIVLDASAVVELLLGGARAEPVLPILERHEGALHAPALLDTEVAHAFRGLTLRGLIQDRRGRAAIEILQALPLHRHPATPLLPRIWELRGRLSAHDATYVALAEALDAPLATFDRRMTALPGLEVVRLAR